MRKRFEQQITLGDIAISDVEFPLKSRDELPPVLRALQYIFVTPEINEKVFTLLEAKIHPKHNETGRPGMDLWHILVLAVVRHATNTNWDTLHGWANYHELIRSIMGVHNQGLNKDRRIEFNYQSILDNVSLLDEDLLKQLNVLVATTGYAISKKKEEDKTNVIPFSGGAKEEGVSAVKEEEAGAEKAQEVSVPNMETASAGNGQEVPAARKEHDNSASKATGMRLKSDSFVIETNIHFPTDLNLLDDSMRKSLDMILRLHNRLVLDNLPRLKGWREIKSWRLTFHNLFRSTNNTVYKGKSEEKKIEIVKKYISVALMLKERCQAIINQPPLIPKAIKFVIETVAALKAYTEYAGKFCDQIERRLIKKGSYPCR